MMRHDGTRSSRGKKPLGVEAESRLRMCHSHERAGYGYSILGAARSDRNAHRLGLRASAGACRVVAARPVAWLWRRHSSQSQDRGALPGQLPETFRHGLFAVVAMLCRDRPLRREGARRCIGQQSLHRFGARRGSDRHCRDRPSRQSPVRNCRERARLGHAQPVQTLTIAVTRLR